MCVCVCMSPGIKNTFYSRRLFFFWGGGESPPCRPTCFQWQKFWLKPLILEFCRYLSVFGFGRYIILEFRRYKINQHKDISYRQNIEQNLMFPTKKHERFRLASFYYTTFVIYACYRHDDRRSLLY